MFKLTTLLAISLLATSFVVGGSKLEADNFNWGSFGVGVGVGVAGSNIYYNSGYRQYPSRYYYYPGYTTYYYPNDVYYYTNNYTNGYAYDYMGSSIVKKMQTDKNSRTLFLENGMVFRISAGSFNWTGYNMSIYRNAYTRENNNYVLVVNNNQFRAQRIEAPVPGAVPPTEVKQPSQAQFTNP